MSGGIAAGDLNQQIDFLRRSGAVDALNQPVPGDWDDYATGVWANIKTPTGMGTIKGAAQGVSASINQYSFRVRFREDITEADAIRYRGRIFNIVAGGIKQDYVNRVVTDFVCEVGGVDG